MSAELLKTCRGFK